MAAARKIITVDLGTSTIKFAEFGLGGGGALTLLRFGVTELGLDPNKEEERAGFITPALTQLFKEHKIKESEVILSISGQSVFMRFVKLPPVSSAQIGEVVKFEAQQNVPFPIDEVTWDYQMMPNRGNGTEAEAVIVAIKKEVLEAEVKAVEDAGVKIKQLDVAPFALLNAFRYSEAQNDDCSLIIDMGARSTNLVFVEKSTFWIRNIPIAGNHISQSICNEMQEPFTAAETLKKGKGFVSLGGVYTDPEDPDAARISKLIRSSMTKLHVDINRSIAFYRNTLNGEAPKRVFLTGGSSQLPYLDLFIADKLSLPVAYFNPLRNVNLGQNLNHALIQQNHFYTAELVGLALRETGSCPAEVTLEAPSLVARADKRRKQPFFYLALIAWLLIFVCYGLYDYEQTVLANGKTEKLKVLANGLRPLAPKLRDLVNQQAGLQQTLNTAVSIGDQRSLWPAILSAINDKIPEGVWITELKPVYETGGGGPGGGPGGKNKGRSGGSGGPGGGGGVEQITALDISGLYHSDKRIMVVESDKLDTFVRDLATLPYFSIDTNNISVALPTNGGDPTVFAQSFTMHLKLKHPISITP